LISLAKLSVRASVSQLGRFLPAGWRGADPCGIILPISNLATLDEALRYAAFLAEDETVELDTTS